MGRRIRDYVKYTFSELERYVQTPTSCVNKINTPLRLNFPPYGMGSFQQTLREILAEKKIGLYDADLKGIILDMRNIKVIGDIAALRYDDPAIHLSLLADCYVFQPTVGAIIRGLVKYTSDRQIGVIIYRVFSVSIRLNGQVPPKVRLNTEIEFRIKQFDLTSYMPFIEGELVQHAADGEEEQEQELETTEFIPSPSKKKVSFAFKTETGSSGYNSDGSHSKHHAKAELKSDSDDDLQQNQPASNASRQFSGSPDLFADLSDSENDFALPANKSAKISQKAPLKVKKEKLSQQIDETESANRHNSSRAERKSRNTSVSQSDMSDLEPGQRIKLEPMRSLALPDIDEEPLSLSHRKKSKHKKHTISISEAPEMDVKPRVKTEKLPNSIIEEQPNEKIEADANRHHKKSKLKSENIKSEDVISSTPNIKASKSKKTSLYDDSLSVAASPSVPENFLGAVYRTEAQDSTIVRHKQKLSDSIDENQQPTPTIRDRKLKKRKISVSDAPVTALIDLDSDFEMTTTMPATKHKKKKKKSKDKTSDRLENTNISAAFEDTIEIVDVDNFSPKKKKKKKSKEKNAGE